MHDSHLNTRKTLHTHVSSPRVLAPVPPGSIAATGPGREEGPDVHPADVFVHGLFFLLLLALALILILILVLIVRFPGRAVAATTNTTTGLSVRGCVCFLGVWSVFRVEWGRDQKKTRQP